MTEPKKWAGGGISQRYKPRFQALYKEMKSLPRCKQYLHLFWPPDIGLPTDRCFYEWMAEVEENKARIPRHIQEWIKGQLEAEEQIALRELTLTYARVGKAVAEKLESGEMKITPTTLKYLADGVGFVAGKRNEIAPRSTKVKVPGTGTTVVTRNGQPAEPTPLRRVK